MDERFLFPEVHLFRQLTKRLEAEFPFKGKKTLPKIFEWLDDLLLIVDKESVIYYANKAALQRFGMSANQLIGKTLVEIMPFPQVQIRWQTILKALEQYKNFSFIDSGNGKYALTHILPFQNSTKEYYLIFTLENQSFASAAFQETLKTVHETPIGADPDHRPEYHLRILQALANAATGASLADDLPTALNTLCTQACLALQAPAAVIRLYNPHQDTLEIAGSYGLSEEHLHKNFAIPYAPLAYLASESAPRVFVADLDQSPPTPADQLPYRPQLAASAVGNIVRQNRFLGVLVILIPKVHPPLTKEDLLLVQAIAEQASISIDRFRLMKIQERRTKELENLVRLGIELREMLTKPEIMGKLLEILAKDSHVRFGATYLLEGQRYVLISSQGEHANVPAWLAVPDNPLWHSGKPLFFDQLFLATDLLTAGSYIPTNSETLIGLAIPLRTPLAVSSVILLGFSRPIRLSSEDHHKIYLLQEIGNAALHRADALEHLEQLVLERTRELGILYEVTALLNAPSELHQAIDQVLDNILSLANCKLVAVHLYDPKAKRLSLYQEKNFLPTSVLSQMSSREEAPPWETVFNQNSTLYLDTSLYDAEGTIPFMYRGFPIRSQGEILGVLSLISSREQIFSLNDQVILTAIADQLGLAIERARLTEQGEEIAKLEERQRLARDLHDALTQSLYSMTLLTSGYKRSLQHATLQEIHQWMDELNDIAQNALAELRLLLYELRPTALEQDGLQGALKRRLDAVERRAGIRTTFAVQGSFRLPPEDEEHFYRIAQEALNNALQHAHHQSIWIHIQSMPNRFKMVIADDGIGFDFDQVIQQNHHSGLNNMLSRAGQIGAELIIETAPGKGTKLFISKEYQHV